MANDVRISATPNADGVLILRTGDAPKIQARQPLTLTGDVSAPFDYAEQRGDLIDKHLALFTFDPERGEVVFHASTSDPLADVITGQAKPSEFLNDFGLKKGAKKIIAREDLIQILKFYRSAFEPSAVSGFVSALADLKARMTGSLDLKNDNRGNRAASNSRELTVDGIPEKMQVSTSTEKGGAVKTFTIDVFMNATETDVNFWFQSGDLAEIGRRAFEDTRERLKKMTAAGWLVICR